MVVSDASIHNIMGGMESTAGVRLHNHRRKLKQRFDIIKKLGQGTYGKVQLGINKETGQEVAIKTIKKAKIETDADLVRIRREIQIMSSVQHPNIIHIYEVFENREKMVLVMEYAAGGELYDFLSEKKVLAEEEARRIFRQIATAVYYCHKHKICHRDLKLENILLDEHGSAKIADFGLSNVFNEQRLLNTFCGSPLYASPEIVKGTPYHGPEVDCWSLGVLLYTLVYGAMPFDGSNFKRLVKQISQGDYFEPKKPSSASPLIREMLTVTPARRANIEKICSHWWVNEGHTESCLEIAEELANQTPVRLDLLLSLAPPPPAVGSDMILTDDKAAGDSHTAHSDTVAPARCHSVGSLMDLDQPSAERKIQEFERHKQKGSAGDGAAAVKDAPKRKLEEGISTEIVPGGAKKKEWCRRSNSQSRPASLVEEKSPEEKMDVDVDVSEPRSSEASKAVSESVSKNDEVVKDTQTIEGAACALPEATQKSLGAEASKASICRDNTTRKSVKGSTKKSKPATTSSTDNVPSSVKTLPNREEELESKKEEELKSKTKAEEEVSIVETNTEGPTIAPSESSKEKTSEEAPVTEAVKQKVKKKKKITSSKSEEIATESAEKKVDSESSLIALNSKPEDSSSQETKKELKKEVAEPEENENSESPSSKDSSSLKTADSSKAGSVKTKKSRVDLSLGKLGSSSDKSSGSEDLVSPTKTVERRRSKIFENSDQFNIFLRGSEQKPVENKPKKVFIPGVKVSDYKQAFERRSSVTPSSSQSPLKTSASKKAVESSSTGTAPCDSSPSDGKSSEVSSSTTDSTLNSSADILETPSKTQEDPASSTETQSSKDIDQNSVESNASKPEINGTHTEAAELAQPSKEEEAELELVPALQVTDKMSQQEKARIKKLKDAVDIISNAIAEETRKESSDAPPVRKISTGKPPVPMSPEKSKSKAAASTKSPPVTPSEKKSMKIPSSPGGGAAAAEITEKAEQQNSGESSHKGVDATAEPETEKVTPAKKKSAKVEITLKSATLPRRRTSKAEIQLGYPPSKIPESVPAGEYRTEVEHMVGSSNPARLQTQRSEVAFPVAAATNVQPLSFRSASLEPEGTPKVKSKPKEHIIPIQLESEREEIRPQSQPQPPPPARPPVPPVQTQRSISQRSSSLSRQSTQDSDTDSTISASGLEPIRKSPREFIIPIAVEGGGYVTPRAGSLEPSLSEATTETSQQHRRSGHSSSRLRKMGSLLSDSEDEGFNSPFVTLQRHGSGTREGENPDDERPFHHMHKLRSSKPRRPTLEHNDSLSSAEEEDDDDDDGFEILTAESLFSTLLSRVRSLTQRLNVEDGGRSGFPSSRLMSHLAASGHSSPSSGFWSNVYGFPGEPLSRRVSESSQFPRPFGPNGEGPTPWRRSGSRDNSDVDSVYSEADAGSLPRGSSRFDSGNLSDDPGFDNSSSCYYTPALARRMQRPWRSSNQSLGYQSPLSQEGTMSDSDWLMHHRKSSLGSMPTQNSNIPQHPSQRLARTLSLHSRTDDRRGKDLPSPHPMDYGRRMDYQPSTRRSLNMLESGIPVHSDSSDRVLPPLPSRDRRRDSSRSSVYSRQRTADLSNSQYSQYSKSNDESTSIRPHHSSSLPTMSRIKSKKSSDGSKTSEKIIREPKIPESEPAITPTSRRVSLHRSLLDNGNTSDRTKIPSLSHLRSSSLVRYGNKGTNYDETSTGSTVKKSSSTCSTSDRSILSKFLRQGSEEKDVSKATENAEDNKDDTKKKRRISRFLRPDFFDTPREESEYAKKKDAKKAAETESKLKSKNNNKKLDSPPLVSIKNDSETKAKGMSEVSLQAKESESKLKSKTNSKKLDSPPLVSVKNNSETKASISEASLQAKETDIKLKSKTNSKNLDNSLPVQQKVDSESQTCQEASLQTKEATTKLKSKTNSKKLDNATSVPEKNGLQPEPKNISDVSLQAKESETMLKPAASDRKVDNSMSVPETNVSESQMSSTSETFSQNIESNSVPIAVDRNAVSVQAKKDVKANKKQNGKEVKATDEAKQNSSTKNNDKKPEANSPAFEKQPSNKNKFLLSLERKLEKFRSSGDDIPSTVNTGKSRVDKAIRSLREQSLSHQGSDITESNLIKRAVSVDDLDSTPKESYGSKIGSKVTSVLGLFRKLEDTPAKTSQSPPKTSVLSRLRRTQSVYAGSQSDSVLVGNVNDSNDGTPVPPLRLKKTNSNSSVKNNTSNTAKKDADITIKTKPTDKENVLHNKETSQNAGKLSGFSNSETALTDVGKGVTKLIRKGSVKLKTKNKQEAEPSLDQVSGIGISESVTAGSMLKPARPASFCAPLQDSISAVTPGAREGILTFNHPRPSSTIISSTPHIDCPNERPVNSIENTVSLPETNMFSNVCASIKNSNGVINEQKLPSENKIIPINADVNTITNGDISLSLSNDINQLPNDDFTLNDDEVKFANVKRLDSCGDECSVASPADELESLDSWSICSDFDGREFPTSPVPPLGDDVEESVVDRIRRKSFYSRFNDIKKKHRKSSLSSLSSSYRDPNSLSSLYYQQSVPRKKEHSSGHHHHHHHSSHHDKPSRSQSLLYDYDPRSTTLHRKSPLPLRTQTSYQGDLSLNSLGTENENHDMNGYVESTRELRDENPRGEVTSNVHCLGGSMETLRMPRHFNSKINLGTTSYHVPTYSRPVRRASDSHLSRSMESSVGSIIPRSQLPISTSRFSNTLISPTDSMTRMGDTLPVHGKYTRYKSPNPLDSPPMFHIGSLTPEEEYERPITPH